ncbi:MAG: ABC-2 family transporter protein, partial [Chloroflexi bacterium]|nr:ABC-2 family transporter protein [Chloroflexota bacterium]
SVILSVSDVLAISILLARFKVVAGWGWGEYAFLYGTVITAFTLHDMINGGFDPDQFSLHIQHGTFDQFLLRPLSVTFQVFASELTLRRIGRMTQSLLVLAFGLALTRPHWTLGKTLYYPVVLLSQYAFFLGLFIIGATVTFWTVKPVEAVNIFTYGGTELMSYPMTIYAEWLRRFFTFVVPAIFLNYLPALYFLDKPDPLGLPAYTHFLAPLAGFAVLAAAFAFWRVGVRHYTSTGS